MERYRLSLINHYPNLDLGRVETEALAARQRSVALCRSAPPGPGYHYSRSHAAQLPPSPSSSLLLPVGDLSWGIGLHILVWKNKELQRGEKAWYLPPILKALCKLYPDRTRQMDAAVLRNWD